jgi:hypothetical protein
MFPEGQYKCAAAIGLSNLDGLTAGSRLARVMRLLRVLRVLRVFNSLHNSCKHRSRVANEKAAKQSAIGKALNEKLVRSMIVVVVALQLIFPLLSFDEKNSARELTLDVLIMGENFSKSEGELYGAAMRGQYLFGGQHKLDLESMTYARSYPTLMKTVISSEALVYIDDQPASTFQGWDGNSYNAADCLSPDADDSFA